MKGLGLVDEKSMQIAIEAVRTYRKEERENERKTRFRNMGLLMNNYMDFVESYEKIQYKAPSVEAYYENMDINITDCDTITIEAIKRSKTRTLIMITQIQTAVDMLKADMEAKGEYEKFLVVKLLYMNPITQHVKFNQRIQLVAEDIKCNESTVRRWNNEMLRKLAVKIFGVDGLNLDL
jgi:hypothetical protein